MLRGKLLLLLPLSLALSSIASPTPSTPSNPFPFGAIAPVRSTATARASDPVTSSALCPSIAPNSGGVLASNRVEALFPAPARCPDKIPDPARSPVKYTNSARSQDKTPTPAISLARGQAADPAKHSDSTDAAGSDSVVTLTGAPARSLFRDPAKALDPLRSTAPDRTSYPVRSLARDSPSEKFLARDSARATARAITSALQRSLGDGQALREEVAQTPFKKVPEDALSLALRVPRVSWDWAAGAVAVVDLGDGERWLRVLHCESLSPIVLWRAKSRSIWGSAPLWLEQQDAYVFAATKRLRMLKFLLQDMKKTGGYYTLGRVLVMYNLTFKENAPIVVSLWDEHLQQSDSLYDEIHPLTYEILLNLKKIGAYFRVLVIEEKPPIIIKSFPDWIDGSVLLSDASSPSTLSVINELALEGLRNTGGMEVPTLYPDDNPLFKVTEVPGVVYVFGAYFRHIKAVEDHFNMKIVIDPELREHILDRFSKYELETKVVYEEFLARGEIVIVPLFSHPSRPEKIIQGTCFVDTTFMVVPLPGPLPAWSLPLRVFGGTIWAALLGAMLAYALAWRVVARQSLLASVAAALRAFSSCGGPPQDRVSATPQRLQLASVLLTSAVIVASAYQGRLFSLVTDPDTYPTVDTLEDLETNEIPVACCSGMCAVLRAFAKLRNVNLKEKYIYTDEMEYIVKNKDPHALIVPKSWWPLWWKKEMDGEKVHIMRETLGELLLSWTSLKGWPWTDGISLLTLYLDSGGLRDFWMTNYSRETEVYLIYTTKNEEGLVFTDLEKGPEVLQIRDFASAFIVLLLGLLSAIFALVVEVRLSIRDTFRRLRQRMQRKKREAVVCPVPLFLHAHPTASAPDNSPPPSDPPLATHPLERTGTSAATNGDTVVDTDTDSLTGSVDDSVTYAATNHANNPVTDSLTSSVDDGVDLLAERLADTLANSVVHSFSDSAANSDTDVDAHPFADAIINTDPHHV